MYEHLSKFCPILPAGDVLPEWWKKININQNVDLIDKRPLTSGTVKRCPGVMDILKSGWVVRAWCDIYVNICCCRMMLKN